MPIYSIESNLLSTDGYSAAIKAGSTAPTAADAALVVTLSPNYTADRVVTASLTGAGQTIVMVTAGKYTVGGNITGTWVGTIISEGSCDGGITWFAIRTANKSTNDIVFQYTANDNFEFYSHGGCTHVRMNMSVYTSGTANIALAATSTAQDALLNYSGTDGDAAPPLRHLSHITFDQGGTPRLNKVANTTPLGTEYGYVTWNLPSLNATSNPVSEAGDRVGHQRPGWDSLLAHDPIEGSTINSWLWTQSTTTMTISQATGVLTLNNSGTLTTTTDAIITTTRQFPFFNHASLKFSMRAAVTIGSTNAIVELGIGAPAGTTAIINNGSFFRLNGTALSCVTSFNGTENVVSEVAILTGGNYYLFIIYMLDDESTFIIEDSTGLQILNTTVDLPVTTPDNAAVSHLPAFARIHNSAAVATAAKLAISAYDTYLVGMDTNKPWGEQLAGAGKGSSINPITFAQTSNLATGTAPTLFTPSNTNNATNTTLGGEFLAAATATNENLLSLFAFTIPSPYTLYITNIFIPPTIVSGAATATTSTVLGFSVVANCSSVSISGGGGQRFTIPAFFQAPSGTGVGGIFNGQPCNFNPTTPIVCLPGTILHIAYKVIVGTATASCANRGSVFINGYFE